MIQKIPLPKKGDDSRELWKIVRLCAVAINALMGLRVLFTGRAFLNWTEGNAILELPPPGSGTAAVIQPLTIQANGAYSVLITPGTVAGDYPLGMDPSVGLVVPVADKQILCARVAMDVSGGAVHDPSSRQIVAVAARPPHDHAAGVFYEVLGSVAVDAQGNVQPTNARFGPVGCLVYRRPASVPPYYEGVVY